MSDNYGMGLATEETFGFDLPGANGFETVSTTDDYEHTDVDVEDLWAIDHDADEQTIKDALPPQGDYEVTLQAGPLTTKEVDGTKLPDQRYFGIGVREVDGVSHKARIRFSLCPRKFIKTNGRTHWAYLMYVSAGQAFLKAHNRKHETYDELSEWLTQGTVKVYVAHTKDNDYMSKDIKPAYSGVPF